MIAALLTMASLARRGYFDRYRSIRGPQVLLISPRISPRRSKISSRRMVPAGMRVDRVELGCKTPVGSALKAVAPGLAQLNSRSFMVELLKDDRPTYCSATMDASRQVLTASRDIQPNEPVTDADFQTAMGRCFWSFDRGIAYVSRSRSVCERDHGARGAAALSKHVSASDRGACGRNGDGVGQERRRSIARAAASPIARRPLATR